MLKQVLFASAALALLAAPSMAVTDGSASQSVTVSASVAAKCSITTNITAIDLGEVADADGTAKATATLVSLSNTSAWCNGAKNTLSVVASPLLNTTTTAGTGFTARLDYKLAYGSFPAVDSVVGSASAPVAGPFSIAGTGNGTVTPIKTADKLVAGAYSGTVVLTLAPGV